MARTRVRDWGWTRWVAASWPGVGAGVVQLGQDGQLEQGDVEPVLIRLLSGLASCAAAGSTLAASLAVHAEGLASAEVLAAANARRRAGQTEPWRTILPRDEQIALLTRQAGGPTRRSTPPTSRSPRQRAATCSCWPIPAGSFRGTARGGSGMAVLSDPDVIIRT